MNEQQDEDGLWVLEKKFKICSSLARTKDDDVCPVFRYLQNQNFVPQNFIFNLE
jgi:hypothetical protein